MAETGALNSPWRSDFPVLSTTMHGKPLAFLDTAASAQKPQGVIDAMDCVLTQRYANIHRGLYDISQQLTADFEAVRGQVAQFIGAESEKNIVFTRNATECINLVAQSWGRTFLQADDEVMITEMEHHANIVPWQILRDQIGIEIKVVPLTPDRQLDLDALENLLSEKTKFVSFVHISNAIGTCNPVSEIISKVRAFNPDIKILVDGSQGAPHKPVNVTEMDADFYVITGHKIYGPTGIGALYGKHDILQEMPPYQGGGDMIERVSFHKTTYREAPYKFEAGTPAIVEVIGLGAAVNYLVDIGMDKIQAHEKNIADYTISSLQDVKGLTLYNGDNTQSIFPFTLDGIHPSDIGMVLDQCGVAVRAGHHCAMPLMEVLGVDATIRASIGMYSSKEDIDALVKGLHKVRDLFG